MTDWLIWGPAILIGIAALALVGAIIWSEVEIRRFDRRQRERDRHV